MGGEAARGAARPANGRRDERRGDCRHAHALAPKTGAIAAARAERLAPRAPKLPPPRLSQALKVKAAIRAGEILLEPTVMVEPPRFKGHKRDRSRPARQAQIEQKMKEMPALIEEYRVERRERREKRRQEERFK